MYLQPTQCYNMVLVYSQVCDIFTESKIEDCSGIRSIMPKQLVEEENKYRHSQVICGKLYKPSHSLFLMPSVGPHRKQEFHKY